MECLEEFRRTVADPPVIAEKDQYLIKFALTEQEIESAFRLRYDVFNLEQGKGLKDSQNGIDKDEFDEHCLHLIVVRKDDNRVVGTYPHSFRSRRRTLQTGLLFGTGISDRRSCTDRSSGDRSRPHLRGAGLPERKRRRSALERDLHADLPERTAFSARLCQS